MLATLAILTRLFEYEVSLVTYARREIRRWANAAAAIPDPTLRRLATQAIAVDASNAEAAAAFASMTPRHVRRAAVELLVVHQILLDYVDMLGERLTAEQLQLGLAIGQALPSAIARPGSRVDLDALGDDGGYLAALIVCCRSGLWRCPSASVVQEHAEVAAARLAHGLAHTHTAARSGVIADLRNWSTKQQGVGGYAWWEIAAGSNSNLALLALLAAASDPLTTHGDVAAITSAYWPHVCVLSTLLDSLVDYECDEAGDNFSFVSRYPDAGAMREALIHATRLSLAAVRPLRHNRAHTMIVSGVAGYYAASAAPGSLAAEVTPSVIAQLDRAATPIVLALRARHHRCCRTRPGRSRMTTS
jgi:tetraprenyl-beta-curcumene synthase